MKDCIDLVKRIGLQSQEAVEFIGEQQQKGQDERQEETDRRREEAELRRKEAELRRGEEQRAVEFRCEEAELRRGEEEQAVEFRREEREHELELVRRNNVAGIDEAGDKKNAERPHGTIPKLPAFVDAKEDLDSY